MGTDVGTSQRDSVKQISPPWLAEGTAEKILYNFGLAGDALLEKLNQAMKAHMPGQGDPSALPLIGNDRVMAQGPNESNDSYAGRLKRSFDSWQRSGSRRSIMAQVLAYVASSANVSATPVPSAAIVNTNGTYATWDVYYSNSDTASPPHHQRVSPSNWNWDNTNPWWQTFLILFFQIVPSATAGSAATLSAPSSGFVTVTGLAGQSTSSVGKFLVITGAANSANNGTFQIASYISATSVTIANPSGVGGDANNGAIAWTLGSYPAIGPSAAWGTPNKTWSSSNTWGVSVSSAYCAGLRDLARLWKGAHTHYPWIVISFGGGNGSAGNEFSPLSSAGAGNPDGNWKNWAKTVSGVAVPSRTTGVAIGRFDAFLDGTAVYQLSTTPTGT